MTERKDGVLFHYLSNPSLLRRIPTLLPLEITAHWVPVYPVKSRDCLTWGAESRFYREAFLELEQTLFVTDGLALEKAIGPKRRDCGGTIGERK